MIAAVHGICIANSLPKTIIPTPTRIVYLLEPAPQTFSKVSKINQSLSRLIKNSRNKTIRESSKENIVANDLGLQRPLQGKEIRLRSVSSRAYPSCQVWHCKGECRQWISWDPIKILAWNPQAGKQAKSGSQNRSKAKTLHTIPSHRAQADSATWFYIFSGHVRAHTYVYILSGEKKKRNS